MEMLSQIQVGASEAFSLISFFLSHSLFLQSTSRLREAKKSSSDETERAKEREGERRRASVMAVCITIR